MRKQQSLSGVWQFQLDPDGQQTVQSLSPDREIQVPLPWQAAFDDLREYSGYAWYRRAFNLEADWLDGEVLLHFGAVDYWCQVYVNGNLVGEHEGGYLPFDIPVRGRVHEGRNEIALKVFDSAQAGITMPRWHEREPAKSGTQPPFDAADIPHGKQEWYINVGGIWQDVALIAVPPRWIDRIHATPDSQSGIIALDVRLAGQSALDSRLRLIVYDGDDQIIETEVPVGRENSLQTSITLESFGLWSLDSPQLYRLEARLETPDSQDALATRFGFREIATRDGKLWLNGEPLYLLAALDQDLYPDTIYTVPSREYLVDQFRKARELGFNCLRCHIKVPDPVYLDIADELGMLVWAEVPSWRTFQIEDPVHQAPLIMDRAVLERVEQTLEGMIDRDYNHPSIIIWTIVNEDWGTTLPFRPEDRAWVADMYDRCKQLDPTRLVVDNSPCPHAWGPNFHVKSDLDDFHIYFTIPDYADGFEDFIEQFAHRPAWTYSPFGEAQRTRQEPLILSEFGNWGQPTMAAMREPNNGRTPAWFDIGPWWSPWDGAPGWPENVEERFQTLGLNSIWPDYDTFAEQSQWHEYDSLKFEIETMRRRAAIEGYVVTELTDAYWEANGLLDFYRGRKVFHDKFARFNAPDVILPLPRRYAFWSDEQADIKLFGSHYSSADWTDAVLSWAGDVESGQRAIRDVRQGSVRFLGDVRCKLPQPQRGSLTRFTLNLDAPDGMRLATNEVDLMVVPPAARQAAFQRPIAVSARYAWEQTSADMGSGNLSIAEAAVEGPQRDVRVEPAPAPATGLEQALKRVGYETVGRLVQGVDVAVANYITRDVLAWLAAGGNLLYLCDSVNPFFWIQPRVGRWITSYTWIRPDVVPRIEMVNPMTVPFRDVAPRWRIVALPYESPELQRDVLGGQVLGWLRQPSLHTIQFRYGRGKAIITTLWLERMLGIDPISTAVFHDLLEYLVSDRCNPGWRVGPPA